MSLNGTFSVVQRVTSPVLWSTRMKSIRPRSKSAMAMAVEIIQRGDALSAEEFAEVGYLDIALARAADMNLVPRFVFRREIVQFLGIFLKTERALDALGPERRPAVRTRMHPLSALVDVPALVARRLRAAQMPDESRAPAYRTVPVLPNVVLRIGGGKRLARGFEPRLHAVVHKERQH